MKKKIALLLATVMCFGCAVGGTLAWLTDKTEEVQNTFTVGDVDITLTETVNGVASTTGTNYDFVPGDILAKDPKITVEAGSEDCFIYVKIEEANNTVTGLTGNVINWNVKSGVWAQIPGTNVWYHNNRVSAGTTLNILADDRVTVNENVTKAMVSTISSNKPKLTFTGYAIQADNIEDKDKNGVVDALDAWAQCGPIS